MHAIFELDHILNCTNKIWYTDQLSKFHLPFFIDLINSSPLIKIETPDIMFENENSMCFLEFFRFDSSKSTNKGSKLETEHYTKVRSNFKKNFSTSEFNNKGVMSDVLEFSYFEERNIENYVSNFIKHFDKHYYKIEQYLSTCEQKSKGKKYEFCFFIHNRCTTPDCILNSERKLKIIYPHNFKVLCEYLSGKKMVQNIFYATPSDDFKYDILYYRTNSGFEKRMKEMNYPKYDEMKLYGFNSKTLFIK